MPQINITALEKYFSKIRLIMHPFDENTKQRNDQEKWLKDIAEGIQLPNGLDTNTMYCIGRFNIKKKEDLQTKIVEVLNKLKLSCLENNDAKLESTKKKIIIDYIAANLDVDLNISTINIQFSDDPSYVRVYVDSIAIYQGIFAFEFEEKKKQKQLFKNKDSYQEKLSAFLQDKQEEIFKDLQEKDYQFPRAIFNMICEIELTLKGETQLCTMPADDNQKKYYVFCLN